MTTLIKRSTRIPTRTKDKSTGQSNITTIKSDRLSQAEIKRMVDDAERFKEQDEAQRARVAARNSLES